MHSGEAPAIIIIDVSAHTTSRIGPDAASRPGSGRQARFSCSTDGVTFTRLGLGFALGNSWQFFMGYRFGIFNYATGSLGGEVTVRRFDLTAP